jgi:hypothetical protein
MYSKTLLMLSCCVVFWQVKAKGERKIGFNAFLTALEHVAVKKVCS